MDLIRKCRKKRVRASLTVEASLIISMTVMVIGIILSLWIYKFQECWYTQAASECLLLGSNKAILNEENYMDEVNSRWNSVIKENYLIPHNFTSEINGNQNQVRIKFEGETPMFGWPSLKIEVEQEIEVVRPVTYIHKRMAIQEVMEK